MFNNLNFKNSLHFLNSCENLIKRKVLKSNDHNLKKLSTSVNKENVKESGVYLNTYVELIQNYKKNNKNNYFFIFNSSDKKIKLPKELECKNYNYLQTNKYKVCLANLNGSDELISNLFFKKQLSKNLEHFYTKSPFIKSDFIIFDESEEINFNLFKQNVLSIDKLKNCKSKDEQMDVILEHFSVTEIEKKIKFTLINYIEEKICQGIFENFEIIPFGSSFTGLGVGYQDLDLVLTPKINILNLNEDLNEDLNDFKNFTFLYKRINDEIQVKKLCLNCLSSFLKLLPGLEVDLNIFRALIPIIKFNSPLVNIEMDLSINFDLQKNGGVLMSQALYSYCNHFPILKKLSLYLRLWTKKNRICSTQPSKKLKNFTFLMLMINFLQTKDNPILPSIKTILTEKNDQLFLPYYENNKNANFDEIIKEFFDFIIKLDFSTFGIDVYNGTLTRNLKKYPMFLKNPFDLVKLNMTDNVDMDTVYELKRTVKIGKKNFDNQDLTDLIKNDNLLKINLSDFK